MIIKFNSKNLRNAEYFQFLSSACEIFDKFGIDSENIGALYAEMRDCLRDAEVALAVERKNEKVREKNEMDRYRDKLHSRLFNYVKSITYDEKDPHFDDAQTVMCVLKEVGNPTKLAENAESAMLTTLGNRLEPYRTEMETIGAQKILETLLDANRQFIAIEIEARQITAAQNLNKTPSMTEVRKRASEVYRIIIDAINGQARLMTKREECREMITEMNVLVAKYDQLLMARKSRTENNE